MKLSEMYPKTPPAPKLVLGDRIAHRDGDVYIIASPHPDDIVLINLKTGRRWSSPVTLNNDRAQAAISGGLTREEAERLTGSSPLDHWTRVD